MPETETGNNREPREALFAQALGKVKETAREQGNRIGGEQVREAFAPLFLEEEQLQLVLDYLRENKIRIDQPEDSDEYLSQEERDYLKDYLEELDDDLDDEFPNTAGERSRPPLSPPWPGRQGPYSF